MAAPVTFYFDFISPYAYLASTQVHALAARHGRSVELVPILFAALLKAHGQKGPAEVPAKRVYTLKNVVRIAAQLGAPIAPPAAHPFNPLLTLRVATAAEEPALRRQVVEVLYRATWSQGRDVTSPAEVAAALTEAGLDATDLLARAATPEVKERLRQATDAALAAGVFGVPTLIADGELFWGTDSHPHVEERLAGRDPVDRLDMAAWLRIPQTATRR